MSENIFKVKVKSDPAQKVIEVYRLENMRFNVFLGDNISVSAIEKEEHMKTYSKEELEFV